MEVNRFTVNSSEARNSSIDIQEEVWPNCDFWECCLILNKVLIFPPGLLSLAHGRKSHENNSEFFITFKKCPWLDGKHVRK